jgi:LCCL domain
VRFLFFVLVAFPITLTAQEPRSPAKPTPPMPVVQLRLVDDSSLKVRLSDDILDFHTEFGRLRIPARQVKKIEFGLRIPEETAKAIERAVADLAHPQYRKREEATALLISLGERAYPAVLKAAQQSDAEVANRAEEIVGKIRGAVAAERLEVPDYDTITTESTRVTGKIQGVNLKVTSASLGELQLKLADLVAMVATDALDERALANALPDPGMLNQYQREIGKILYFKVVGKNAGSLWGTDFYTLDSTLGMAAVHAGIVKVGQAGIVKVQIQGPNVVGFTGSTRNGITSAPYDAYPGAYKILPLK